MPIENVPDTVRSLFIQALSAALDDELWQLFRFRRRPRWAGTLFRPFMTAENREIEPALFRELYMLTHGVHIQVIAAAGPREQTSRVVAAQLGLLMRGLPGAAGPEPWTSFRYGDESETLSHVTAGIREYVATDGSDAALSSVMISHAPSERVRKRWVSGAPLLFSFGYPLRVRSTVAAALETPTGRRDLERVGDTSEPYRGCAQFILTGEL